MYAGLEPIGIFDVVFRPGDQTSYIPTDFQYCWQIAPSKYQSRWQSFRQLHIRSRLFGRTGAGDEQRRNNSKRE